MIEFVILIKKTELFKGAERISDRRLNICSILNSIYFQRFKPVRNIRKNLTHPQGGKSMYTSSHIRRYINRLTDNDIFSTREFLNFGKRAAVDKCLSRLVKRGDIIRLARGLFKKFDGNSLPIAYVVALHKARAFGKQIVMHANDAAKVCKLTLSNNDTKNKDMSEPSWVIQSTYSINSHSSQFHYGKRLIRFCGISARKMFLGDSPVGLTIRALWHLGKYNCNERAIMIALLTFSRQQRQELRQSAHLMPAWLADKLFRTEGLFST